MLFVCMLNTTALLGSDGEEPCCTWKAVEPGFTCLQDSIELNTFFSSALRFIVQDLHCRIGRALFFQFLTSWSETR